jgi:hypothetical protein
MESKVCSKCGEDKPLTEFRNRTDSKDGKRGNCIICQDNYLKTYNKANADYIAIQRKGFYDENQKRLLDIKKEYYDANKERLIKRQTEYDRVKKQKDPIYRFKKNIRTMIGKSLTKKGYTKKSQSFLIIGCLQDEFIQYIESLWKPWMNWDNYGLYNGELDYGWDIDHIIPLITATTEEEIIKLNHYSNLQPLCGKVNRKIKRDSY